MAIRVEPSERTTVSKKRRNAVLAVSDHLNQQDAMIRSSMGLTHPSRVTYPEVKLKRPDPANPRAKPHFHRSIPSAARWV